MWVTADCGRGGLVVAATTVSHYRIGELFQGQGQVDQAIPELERARDVGTALVKQFPDAPRYRE
jgi:hypothetical protein